LGVHDGSLERSYVRLRWDLIVVFTLRPVDIVWYDSNQKMIRSVYYNNSPAANKVKEVSIEGEKYDISNKFTENNPLS
jgi:hypothetical protein